MKYHPDRNINSSPKEQTENLEKFKYIKACHDFLLKNFSNLNTSFYNNKYYNDFDKKHMDENDFESVFNDFFKSYSEKNKRQSFKPITRQYISKHKIVKISLSEYFSGCKKEIKFDIKFEKCKSCNYSYSPSLCSETCQKTRWEQNSVLKTIDINKNIILPDHQTKIIPISEFISVQLHLDFEINLSKKFKIENNNVYMDLKVPYHIAILGGEVSFKYFDSKNYLLKIPPLSQNNSLMRISKKGLTFKKIGGYPEQYIGDLILKINIVIPKRLSKTTAEKLKEVYKNDEFVSLDNSAFE